jgi:hypothetical protein
LRFRFCLLLEAFFESEWRGLLVSLISPLRRNLSKRGQDKKIAEEKAKGPRCENFIFEISCNQIHHHIHLSGKKRAEVEAKNTFGKILELP